jgi:hypothetical protein
VNHQIGVAQRGRGLRAEGDVKIVLGLQDSRRIDEDGLPIRVGDEAYDTPSSRLRFGTGDGEFGLNESVEERGLAHVRLADDGDEAAELVTAQGWFSHLKFLGRQACATLVLAVVYRSKFAFFLSP